LKSCFIPRLKLLHVCRPGMSNSSFDSRSRLDVAFWCIFYAAGVITFMVLQGAHQERIVTVPYGNSGDSVLFRYEEFLVLCCRTCTAIFAAVLMIMRQEQFVCVAPAWTYGIASLSNVLASVCRYEALKYITFPILMVAKSCKMLPVMIWSWVLRGKTYSARDWLIAVTITGGVAAFSLTGPVAAEQHEESASNTAKGFILILLDMVLDNFTTAYEEHLFSEYKMSRFNQMFFISLFSGLVSLTWCTVSGGLTHSISFIASYPTFVRDTSILSTSAAAAQFFLFSQVKEFGALVYAATANVRQVVSIVVSYLTYGHYITNLQLLSLVSIFAPMLYKSSRALLDDQAAEKRPLLQDKEPKIIDASLAA